MALFNQESARREMIFFRRDGAAAAPGREVTAAGTIAGCNGDHHSVGFRRREPLFLGA
jgi:hypothetical protein